MPKRLTHEFISAQFEKEGYKLTDPYQNSQTPIGCVCPKGHLRKIRYSDFKQGHRCPACGGTERLQHKDVALQFEKEGYKLLGEYKNAHAPIEFICPSGHRNRIRYSDFKKGHRCASCGGTGKLSHKEVADRLAKEGYTLLTEYKNTAGRFEFICPAGHRHSMAYSNFYSGNRCALCAGRAVLPDTVQEAFDKEGYTLLTRYDRDKGNKSPLRYLCTKNHMHVVSWNSFSKGSRCPYCAKKKVMLSDVYADFTRAGFEVLGEYKESGIKVKMRCPKGHICHISRDGIKRGRGCGKCAERGFNPEKPGTLYYIAFNHPAHPTPLYKIGITNRTVQERFAPEPTPYRIIHTESYLFGFLAYEKEQRILAQHAAHKYTGANLLVSGNTELFTRDILNLDKAAHKQSPLPDRRSA